MLTLVGAAGCHCLMIDIGRTATFCSRFRAEEPRPMSNQTCNQTSSQTNNQTRNIVCPHCTAVNRIPLDKPAGSAKCGRCHGPLFTGKPFPVTAESFATHFLHNDIPVVVDFWADWCGPCKAMAPVFERVAAELEPNVRFLKIDTQSEQDVAARYDVRSIPTLILFRNNKVIARRSGATDQRSLRAWVEQAMARSPEAAA
jgi:thioredoxin 2